MPSPSRSISNGSFGTSALCAEVKVIFALFSMLLCAINSPKGHVSGPECLKKKVAMPLIKFWLMIDTPLICFVEVDIISPKMI